MIHYTKQGKNRTRDVCPLRSLIPPVLVMNVLVCDVEVVLLVMVSVRSVEFVLFVMIVVIVTGDRDIAVHVAGVRVWFG